MNASISLEKAIFLHFFGLGPVTQADFVEQCIAHRSGNLGNEDVQVNHRYWYLIL
jgi:hypothetical protein